MDPVLPALHGAGPHPRDPQARDPGQSLEALRRQAPSPPLLGPRRRQLRQGQGMWLAGGLLLEWAASLAKGGPEFGARWERGLQESAMWPIHSLGWVCIASWTSSRTCRQLGPVRAATRPGAEFLQRVFPVLTGRGPEYPLFRADWFFFQTISLCLCLSSSIFKQKQDGEPTVGRGCFP